MTLNDSILRGGLIERGDTADICEQAALSHEKSVHFAVVGIRSSDLREMRDAEDRRKKGVSQFCKDCNHQIPPARLEAKPYATRCVECQKKFEPKHARCC